MIELWQIINEAWRLIAMYVGAVFLILLALGLRRNPLQALIAFDQFAATCLIRGAMADETISAWAHRTQRKRAERFINFLFRDPNHCAAAYISEMDGTQNAAEYNQ